MSKFTVFILLLVFMMAFGSMDLFAETKPPLSAGRIAGEILVGGIGGTAGVLVPISWGHSKSTNDEFGCYFFMSGCIVSITYPLASAIGVYLVGNIGDESGSFFATLAGSFLGGLVGMITWAWSLEHEDWQTVIPGFFAAPLGATIGFNLTRKYNKLPSANKSAPIRIDLLKVRF